MARGTSQEFFVNPFPIIRRIMELVESGSWSSTDDIRYEEDGSFPTYEICQVSTQLSPEDDVDSSSDSQWSSADQSTSETLVAEIKTEVERHLNQPDDDICQPNDDEIREGNALYLPMLHEKFRNYRYQHALVPDDWALVLGQNICNLCDKQTNLIYPLFHADGEVNRLICAECIPDAYMATEPECNIDQFRKDLREAGAERVEYIKSLIRAVMSS